MTTIVDDMRDKSFNFQFSLTLVNVECHPRISTPDRYLRYVLRRSSLSTHRRVDIPALDFTTEYGWNEVTLAQSRNRRPKEILYRSSLAYKYEYLLLPVLSLTSLLIDFGQNEVAQPHFHGVCFHSRWQQPSPRSDKHPSQSYAQRPPLRSVRTAAIALYGHDRHTSPPALFRRPCQSTEPMNHCSKVSCSSTLHMAPTSPRPRSKHHSS